MNTESILTEWRQWQRAIGRAERTIKERDYTLAHFFATSGATPADFTEAHVIAYIGRRELSAASKASYHTVLKTFTTWLLKTGRRTDDPMRLIPATPRPKGLPRPVRDSQLAAILAHAQRQHTRSKIQLAALQGLRVHEVAKVAGEDVDLEAGSLTVLGKGSKQALIPLHPDIAALAHFYPRQGYWFPSDRTRSGHVTGKSVSTVIARAMERAGVDATPHQLRHWYGTRLLKQTGDMRVVQELMRHENIQSTQIYTRVDPNRQRAALEGLELPAA